MSAFGGKADEDHSPTEGLLVATRRHSHPDKSYIGRTERGFDFLGNDFSPEGLTLAANTIERFVARAIRLYEQELGKALASSRFGEYLWRWVKWAAAGIADQVCDTITVS